MQVKINQKKYKVPELTFEHYTQMEDQGFSIVDAVKKNQYMLIAMGFTCVVTGEERSEAERLLTQHVLGGGNIYDITHAFFDAVNESDFFMKMLGMTKENPVEKDQDAKAQEEIPKNNQENESK